MCRTLRRVVQDLINKGSIIPPSPKSSVAANPLPKHELPRDDDEVDYTYLMNFIIKKGS